MLKLVDDIPVHAPSLVDLRGRIRGVPQRCRAHGIVLSKKKFEIGRNVYFAGHKVTDGSIRPDEERLGVISKFPKPQDTHQLRSFLGLANQLGNFLPNLAAGTVQMRGLLRKRMAWVWTPDHKKEFVAVKKLLTSAPAAHYFDLQLESKLLTDASRSGIGFALIQEGPEGQKINYVRLAGITFGRVPLRPGGVGGGVVYAIQKCAFYIMGAPKPFTVVTDHKPLLVVFYKPLSETPNPQLQLQLYRRPRRPGPCRRWGWTCSTPVGRATSSWWTGIRATPLCSGSLLPPPPRWCVPWRGGVSCLASRL